MAQMSLSTAIFRDRSCHSFYRIEFCKIGIRADGDDGYRAWREEIIEHIDESQNRVLCYQQTINNGLGCWLQHISGRLKPRDDLRASD